VIGSVRGAVIERIPPGEVVVEVGGVGYRVIVPTATLAEVVTPGAEILLHTHLHVREDALTLYGFPTRDERACFEALIGAHGVGPALALAILSVHRPAALQQALADDDVDALCLVPGVGKKTAARLLIELKTRLHVPDLDLADAGGPQAGGNGSSPTAEVRAALTQLGYGPDEIRAAVRELPSEGDVEVLLRAALQRLAASR
jgi:holliday junction DNA helicase RuvA